MLVAFRMLIASSASDLIECNRVSTVHSLPIIGDRKPEKPEIPANLLGMIHVSGRCRVRHGWERLERKMYKSREGKYEKNYLG